jgi:hypothetical protein
MVKEYTLDDEVRKDLPGLAKDISDALGCEIAELAALYYNQGIKDCVKKIQNLDNASKKSLVSSLESLKIGVSDKYH